jgi:hypothetical protein
MGGHMNSSVASAIFQLNRDFITHKTYSLERVARHLSWVQLAGSEFIESQDSDLLIQYREELSDYLQSMLVDAHQLDPLTVSQDLSHMDSKLLPPNSKRARVEEMNV